MMSSVSFGISGPVLPCPRRQVGNWGQLASMDVDRRYLSLFLIFLVVVGLWTRRPER